MTTFAERLKAAMKEEKEFRLKTAQQNDDLGLIPLWGNNDGGTVHVTNDGALAIEYKGTITVKTFAAWNQLAASERVDDAWKEDPEIYANLSSATFRRGRLWDPDGKITPAFRAVELGGEVGEALNVIKKLERERLGIRGSKSDIAHLAEELSDIIIVVVALALDYGIDLSTAIPEKFNQTSVANDLPVRLDHDWTLL